MHVLAAFSLDDPNEILRLLRATAFGHLVTHSTDSDQPAQLQSTAVPFLVDDDLATVRAHVARANPHWRMAADASSLLIVPIVDAYVSPRWYPSKAEHGKVVPTWNYEVIHVRGTVEVHHDPVWLRQVVTDLTDRNEQVVSDDERTSSWAVTDAPPDFIDKQLRAIVGLQLNVTSVEAKQKLSQNRPAADRDGAIAGLQSSTRRHDRETAASMVRARPPDE